MLIQKRLLTSLLVFFGGALALCLLSRAQPRAASPEPTLQPDAIVVGAGISGLSAAWELAQGGARVTVVDMASVFGGHAVMASGHLSIADTPYQTANNVRDTVELAQGDFIKWGEDANEEWVWYYVRNSRREIYDWITGMGVTFDALLHPPGNSVPRMHQVKGRGRALVTPIYRACLQHPNITFAWNTRVDRLLHLEQRVSGVAVTELRSGKAAELRAHSVVLTTGGYQSNLDLVRQFWPTGLPIPEKLLIGSGPNSVGSGLKLAQAAGAAVDRLDHQWNYLTGLPHPRLPGTNRGLNAYNNDSIWVNTDGQRFIAERTSTKFGMAVLLQQKGQTYWSIFDQATKPNFWVAGTEWGEFSEIEKWIFQDPSLVKSADTLEALAGLTGLPADALRKTVREYNEMVRQGNDTAFGRFGPGKPFQPKPVAVPPFYAAQFFPITRKSMGGVVIDESCRVLDVDRRVIAGLYAAGELTGLAGINGKAGLEGTFLGPSIVTGRMAGRTALKDAGRSPGPDVAAAFAEKRIIKPDPHASTQLCLSCHDLPKLVSQLRPGYWHFEKVHSEVVQQKLDCTKCHAELSATFMPGLHRIDRAAQIDTCITCHKGEDR